ncbi:MAG: acetoacetate decarboxylase family protein [Jatrophihabitantaceae bacterium]
MSDYPPEPWDLRGQLHSSVYLVPFDQIPTDLPPGWRPIQIGGRAIVGTAWVTYGPGGVLEYNELMATVLVRRGRHLRPTITHIWVDSAASREGGRALWGIPKELAEFTVDGVRFAAVDGDGPIAKGTVRVGRRPTRPVAAAVQPRPVARRRREGVERPLPSAGRSGAGHVRHRPERSARVPGRSVQHPLLLARPTSPRRGPGWSSSRPGR